MSEGKKVQSAHLTYHERRKFHQERLEEMKIVAEYMDDEKLVEIADKIDKSNSVFVVALGRSRMNIMAFAMRLRQMRTGRRMVTVSQLRQPNPARRAADAPASARSGVK